MLLAVDDVLAGTGSKEPGRLTWLVTFAAPFNLRVGSTYGGNHVIGSYHYRYRAIDGYGPEEAMRACAAAAFRRPSDFREVFHDPLGRYVKNGEVRLGKIGGHEDHVHLAR